jgi:carboxypeptidase C (cathepsin A)
VRNWDFSPEKQGESGYADTSQGLRHAFAKNQYLRVYLAEGLYDAATPYFAAEYTLNHMGLTPENHKNITTSRFPAGHMVYIERESMTKLHAEVDRFFAQSVATSVE